MGRFRRRQLLSSNISIKIPRLFEVMGIFFILLDETIYTKNYILRMRIRLQLIKSVQGDIILHEASVAKDVLEIILETLDGDSDLSGKKVNTIKFSQSFPPTVVPDSFEFYFTELVKGTLIEGADLIFLQSEEHGFFISSIEVD